MDRNTEIREKGLVSNNAFATYSIGMWIAEMLGKGSYLASSGKSFFPFSVYSMTKKEMNVKS